MIEGFRKIAGEERESLIGKCQENGWLMREGFAWQDDPFLEDYPYDFAATDDVERLRGALAQGNWAIRQGFAYKDLCFVQQVDGGDEWWSLKRDGGGWTAFDSISFERMAAKPEAFESAIERMASCTPAECREGKWRASGLALRAEQARSANAARAAGQAVPERKEPVHG